MVKPLVDSIVKNQVRSSKRWIVFSILLSVLLLGGIFLLFAWPYKGWAYANVSCGTRPVLGIETKANGSFGTDGKVAVLPGDAGYDRNIISDRFFYAKDVSYFCDEQSAAKSGFMTQAAFDTAHPGPGYAMETPTFKLQSLLDREYTFEDEEISYGYGEWNGTVKHPYYQTEYIKRITSEKTDNYNLTQYKIDNTQLNHCSIGLFSPHGNAVAPRISDTPWQECRQIGILSRGVALYKGIVAEYGYSVYFANINGTLVALTRASFPEIDDALQLFNSLVDYIPTTVNRYPIYQRDNPIDVPY